MCNALERLDVTAVTEEQIADMEKLFHDAHLTTEQQVSNPLPRPYLDDVCVTDIYIYI